MYRVRGKTSNYNIIFYASTNTELSYWIMKENINQNDIIIEDLRKDDYFRETPLDRIRKRRNLIIDDLLKGL